MPRRHLNGASQSLKSGSHKSAETDSTGLDMEHARAEIERLKLELALARDELESLTEATSDFVRLML
jgi:outer membrane protein TolC